MPGTVNYPSLKEGGLLARPGTLKLVIDLPLVVNFLKKKESNHTKKYGCPKVN